MIVLVIIINLRTFNRNETIMIRKYLPRQHNEELMVAHLGHMKEHSRIHSNFRTN